MIGKYVAHKGSFVLVKVEGDPVFNFAIVNGFDSTTGKWDFAYEYLTAEGECGAAARLVEKVGEMCDF